MAPIHTGTCGWKYPSCVGLAYSKASGIDQWLLTLPLRDRTGALRE
jgi:hypothetical protein